MKPSDVARELPTRSRPPAAWEGANDRTLIARWLRTFDTPAMAEKRAMGKPLDRGDLSQTQRAYSNDAVQFSEWIRKPLRDVTEDDIRVYVGALHARYTRPGASGATVGRKLASVKSLLKYLERIGAVRRNVAATVKTPQVEDTGAKRQLSAAQIFRLFSHATGNSPANERRNRVLLKTLYATGARVSEVANLRWGQVNAAGDRGIIGLHGKGGRWRHVGISRALLLDLRELRAERNGSPEDSVFGLTPRTIAFIVRWQAKHRIDVAGVSPHWLRHAHATHAYKNGSPLLVVQKTLGHRSPATTARYVDLAAEESSSYALGV